MNNLVSYNQQRKAPFSGTIPIFNHIPKAAGTTFHTVLEQTFQGNYQKLESIDDWEVLQQRVHRGDSIGALGGHASWGAHELLPERSRYGYITFLRHPATLFLSTHFFRKQVHLEFRSIEEYVENATPNLMVHWLGYGDLPLAKERLYKHYLGFGLVERFEDSLDHFRSLFRLENKPFSEQNKSNWSLESIDSKLLQQIEERNWDDYQLYNWAVEEFNRRFEDSTTDHSSQSVGQSSAPEKNKIFVAPLPQIEELYRSENLTQIEQLLHHDKIPPDSKLRFGLAEAYRKRGNTGAALRVLQTVHPYTFGVVKRQLGILRKHNSSEAYDLATQQYQRFLPFATKTADSFLNRNLHWLLRFLIQIEDQKNNREEVVSLFTQAFNLNPTDHKTRALQSRIGRAEL